MIEMKDKNNIQELFEKFKLKHSYLKVCAPMVRYSKVQFRTLVKNYGTDLTFTPMILADSFCQNAKARSNEFMTTVEDSPVIVQFAAKNADDFVDASKLVYPYSDGVDLNCGCPQKWAMNDGYGSALLLQPNVIQDIVRGIRSNLPNSYSVSVKIRILKDLRKTIDLCQKLEKCGVTFLTVHGRTPQQKSGDSIDIMALEDICKSVQVPIIANGGIRTLNDADILYDKIKCNGVMAASGILTNPAMFSGVNKTPISCIKLWKDLKDKNSDKITFQCYHHHLVFMLEKVLTKQQKQVFNYLTSFDSVDEYLNKYILPLVNCNIDVKNDFGDFVTCEYPEEITMKHAKKCRGCSRSISFCICSRYDHTTSKGSFFSSYIQPKDDLDNLEYLFKEPF